MQKNIYLLILLFSLVSCYTYQVKKPATPTIDNKQQSGKNATLAGNTSSQTKNTTAESQNLNSQQPPINIKEKLAPNKNVRIDVDGRTYKVIVDKWENDSLVAHPVRDSKKTLKFHKNQINAERIAEKRFSQPIADIITVVAYAGIGVGIWALLQ